jgi:hypothetical protein
VIPLTPSRFGRLLHSPVRLRPALALVLALPLAHGRVRAAPFDGSQPVDASLHVRGGSYLEPSRTGNGARLHGTFGLELRIPCWPGDLSLGFAGDVSSRFQQIGLSAGWWSDVGPGRAPARGPGSKG